MYWPQPKVVDGEQTRHLIPINPDGFLSVVENRPNKWQPRDRVIILVHGLTGSEDSTHLVRLALAFVRRGFLTIRVNMRGCGPGQDLASGIYHSGRSEDTRAVLQWVGSRFGGSPVTQIGISLGGNATLKMMGEYADDCPKYLDSVVAVSAPIDLARCSERISHWKNVIFDRYFTGRLVSYIEQAHQRVPDRVPPLPKDWARGAKTLTRLDDLYVGPVSGFRDGRDYYDRCSAGPLIDRIRCKTLLLTASDDPIIDPQAYLRLSPNKFCDVRITKYGGHAAWIQRQPDAEFGRFWMDQFVVRWVMKRAQEIGSGERVFKTI